MGVGLCLPLLSRAVYQGYAHAASANSDSEVRTIRGEEAHSGTGGELLLELACGEAVLGDLAVEAFRPGLELERVEVVVDSDARGCAGARDEASAAATMKETPILILATNGPPTAKVEAGDAGHEITIDNVAHYSIDGEDKKAYEEQLSR